MSIDEERLRAGQTHYTVRLLLYGIVYVIVGRYIVRNNNATNIVTILLIVLLLCTEMCVQRRCCKIRILLRSSRVAIKLRSNAAVKFGGWRRRPLLTTE